MERLIGAVKKYKIIPMIIAALVAVAILAIYINAQTEIIKPDATRTMESSTLHPTYTSIDEMMKDPELSFVGRAIVADDGKVRSQIVPNAPTEAPPIVHTDYRLKVESVIFGQNIPNKITISVMGGQVEETRYLYENIPDLKKGDTVIVFALLGDDGKYYPLSGDTAVAIQKDDSHFTLSEGTINTGPVTFTERDVRK